MGDKQRVILFRAFFFCLTFRSLDITRHGFSRGGGGKCRILRKRMSRAHDVWTIKMNSIKTSYNTAFLYPALPVPVIAITRPFPFSLTALRFQIDNKVRRGSAWYFVYVIATSTAVVAVYPPLSFQPTTASARASL